MKVEIKLKDDTGKLYQGILTLAPGKIDREKVQVKQIKNVNKSSPQSRIVELAEDGFFKSPKLASDIQNELGTRGYHYNIDPQIRVALLRLIRKKCLRRVDEGKGKKKLYKYVDN